MPCPSPDLPERVRETIACHRMIAPGMRVLAAVSGGADSMALLHLLIALEYQIEVAHLDHGTRNGESAVDAAFVQDTAARLGLTCHVERRDVAHEAKVSGQSFEARARKVRYTFLRRVAEARKCPVIATGHHGDDQAETLLLRLLRGTSPEGLGGIPPVRLMGELKIVRPLIACSREDLVTWLTGQGHAWREDLSNTDTRFLRNRVRHELLPMLTDYNPAIREALRRLADTQRCENACLEALARDAERGCRDDDRLDREGFRKLPEALRRRVMLRYAFDLGAVPSHEVLVKAVAWVSGSATGKECDLGRGVRLYLGKNRVEAVGPRQAPPVTAIPLAIPGVSEAPGHRFRVRFLEDAPGNLAAYCNAQRQVFDAAKLRRAVIRTRRPGDVFQPLGMTGHRKLKEWFIDAGVPRPARDTRLLLARGDTILWVPGGPPSAGAAVTPSTTSFLEVQVDHDH